MGSFISSGTHPPPRVTLYAHAEPISQRYYQKWYPKLKLSRRTLQWPWKI